MEYICTSITDRLQSRPTPYNIYMLQPAPNQAASSTIRGISLSSKYFMLSRFGVNDGDAIYTADQESDYEIDLTDDH